MKKNDSYYAYMLNKEYERTHPDLFEEKTTKKRSVPKKKRNSFIKSTIECDEESELIPVNMNIFKITKQRVLTATEAGIYLAMCAIIRGEKNAILTPETVKQCCYESLNQIKGVFKKLQKTKLLFKIKDKKDISGYVLTEYQEEDEDIKKFLEQKHPEWTLVETEE